MKRFLPALLLILSAIPVRSLAQSPTSGFASMLNDFYEEGIRLSPVSATFNGDLRYNDQLPAEFTDSYRAVMAAYYKKYQDKLASFNRSGLSENDQLSYDVLKWRLSISQEGLRQKDNRIPFSQFQGMPLTLAQFGSGSVGQPFKTVSDYDNWLKRAGAFSAWADSAIVYFKKGMAEQIVLPKPLVAKMIPQLESFVTNDATKSLFYGPVKNMPATFSEADKKRLTEAYVQLINQTIVPSYKKLADFVKNEYLPRARTTSGIGEIPGGKSAYAYLVRQITTTDKTPEEIHQIGLSEVKRIRAEMEKVKASVGFTGDLKAFFDYMQKDPKFFPYKTAEEVLRDYRAIQPQIESTLQRMFLHKPKTGFEVRQTEAFRAASAAAQYFPGLPDGSRPGIFYVPIVDPLRTTNARQSLFVHEAIPGHHYQLMLQRENESLPAFRRYGGFTAYSEGWGLYTEGLGKELGLYTDPYQYMRALGDEIHRAIRLVVDAGMHAKGWTREQAIQYTMENEPIEEQRAISETERYMAIPGQALAYKIGGLKLQELRARYEKKLGKKFNIAAFHDAILKDGALPLAILEKKMDAWAETVK
jgi:uncharacterized protein (DUF885 family)